MADNLDDDDDGGLTPGLKTRWDCCEENRGWVYKEIERRKPKARTVFSAPQQYLSERKGAGEARYPKRYREVLIFLRFALRVAKLQLEGGRDSYLEHPWLSAMWHWAEVRRLLRHSWVRKIFLDQFETKSNSG